MLSPGLTFFCNTVKTWFLPFFPSESAGAKIFVFSKKYLARSRVALAHLGGGGFQLLLARLGRDPIEVLLLDVHCGLGVAVGREGFFIVGPGKGVRIELVGALVIGLRQCVLDLGLVQQGLGVVDVFLVTAVDQFLFLSLGRNQRRLGLLQFRAVASILNREKQSARLDLLAFLGDEDLRDDAADLRRDDDLDVRHDEAGQIEQHLPRRFARVDEHIGFGHVIGLAIGVAGQAGDGEDDSGEHPEEQTLTAATAAAAALVIGDLEIAQPGRDLLGDGRHKRGRLFDRLRWLVHGSYLPAWRAFSRVSAPRVALTWGAYARESSPRVFLAYLS